MIQRSLLPVLACAASLAPASFPALHAQSGDATAVLSILADQPGPKIAPTMYGIFFEDINFGADGGLYAELVKNRSFEFTEPFMGWTKMGEDTGLGTMTLATPMALHPNNPHYLRLKATGSGLGLENEGFSGMGVKAGKLYDFSVQARDRGATPAALRIELLNPEGNVLASAKLAKFSGGWEPRSVSLRPSATEPKARLRVLTDGPCELDLDMISLFPRDTWKGRPGGLRADLVQMLADLKPGFMRFPGGCIVEGRNLSLRYQWKTTLGAPEQRKLILNRWNDEFKHRPTPDYFQSFGLGFYEYFLMCEDIGAAPLPILNCGMACQFNSGELAPLDQLDPYIQDALDLIEFANGPVDSTWGAVRASLGHPKPFNMKLLGVGNEQWGPQYVERYALFAKALKQRYPEVQLISSAGPGPDDDRYQFLWPKLRALNADIIDEHCYANPDWFFKNTARYDAFDRNGPKIFMGEYAAQSVKTVSPDNRNTLECALSEAAYMTGLERNADVVVMSSYAPLFAHVDRWQWTPNLIWFDNLSVYGTPSYYAQQLFSRNRGDTVLPMRWSGAETQSARVHFTASQDTKAGEIMAKVVNATEAPVTLEVRLEGIRKVGNGTATVLTSQFLADINTALEPRLVAPVTTPFAPKTTIFNYTFPARSLTVLRLPAKR